MIEPSFPLHVSSEIVSPEASIAGPGDATMVYGTTTSVHPFPSVTVKVYVPPTAPVKSGVGLAVPFQS